MKLPAMPWPVEVALRCCACLLVPLVVVGLSVFVASAATALPDNATFRIDDHVVTMQEFDNRLVTLKALYGVVPPPDNSKRDEFRRTTARAIAQSMVLENAAQQRGIVVAERAARDILAQRIDQSFQSGRDGFADFLKSTGASEQQVIDAIRLQQSVALLFQSVVGASPETVTDDDMRRYYDDHKNELGQPETRRLLTVVVASEATAREVLDKARAGADFAGLVNQYSVDASRRASGGDLGFVAREQLPNPYADAAFTAQPGTVFGPVKADSGWIVSKVLEIRAGMLPEFDQIKDQLRADMAQKRALDKWNAWVDQRMRSADIQYADAYRPAPDTRTEMSASIALPHPDPVGRPQ